MDTARVVFDIALPVGRSRRLFLVSRGHVEIVFPLFVSVASFSKLLRL